MSMPSGEVDTTRLIDSILSAGKILYLPRINHDVGALDMLRIYDSEDLKTLTKGTWGIQEPDPERNGQRRNNLTDPDSPLLDLVILPGLAFDREMSRLGHGKGYYDRFLTSYQSTVAERLRTDIHSVKMPALFGLSLSQQLLDPSLGCIPTTNTDWSVDAVVSPDGVLYKPSTSDT